MRPLGSLAKKNNRLGRVFGYISSMTTLEIKTLPTEEKLRIMEVIWEDMREWDRVKLAIGRG